MGILSIVVQPPSVFLEHDLVGKPVATLPDHALRDKIQVAGRKLFSGHATPNLALHVPPLRPPRFLISFGFGPEIALQRTHLEVTPKISFDALRCSDRLSARAVAPSVVLKTR